MFYYCQILSNLSYTCCNLSPGLAIVCQKPLPGENLVFEIPTLAQSPLTGITIIDLLNCEYHIIMGMHDLFLIPWVKMVFQITYPLYLKKMNIHPQITQSSHIRGSFSTIIAGKYILYTF